MTCDCNWCKRVSMLTYAAFANSSKEVHVCELHWEKHCNSNDPFDLRTHFKER